MIIRYENYFSNVAASLVAVRSCRHDQAPEEFQGSSHSNPRLQVLFLWLCIGRLLGPGAFCLILLWGASAFGLETNLASVAGVEIGAYNTWARSVSLVASNGVRATVIPSIGGRIVNYSLAGENILFDAASGTNETFRMPGYQCDIGPELAELPTHNTLWMGVNNWQYKPYTVKTMSDPDEVLGLQLTKEIFIAPDSGELALTQRIRNIQTNDVSYCLWDRTLCQPGGYAFFPLNKKSRFKKGWTVHSAWNGSFYFDGEKYVSDEVKVEDGVLIALCDGEPTKVAADSDAEWIAYVRGKLLFVKYFPYSPGEVYSDGGNSVEVYFDRDVAELQVLSPEVKLAPGLNYSFPEKWMLIPLDRPVTGFKEVRKLVKRIPPSPFKK